MEPKLIDIQKFKDERGFFLQTYTPSLGLTETYYQDCVSFSKKNVCRGIHFQVLKPMSKIVTVLSGKIIDYIVDLRVNSPTYLQVIKFELTEDRPQSLFIPKGYGHAFFSLEDSLVSYKCSEVYHKSLDRTINVYDNLVDLQLPVSKENVILSEKDLNGMSISDYQKDFIFTVENTE